MITMTATEASRNFSEVLDRVEHGETVLVTRGGRNVATVERAPASNSGALREFLATHEPDPTWADDLADLRGSLRLDPSPWDDL